MRSTLAWLLCCFSLAIIGCGKAAQDGGGSPLNSAGSSPSAVLRNFDVQSLLTKEEVGAIIGVPVTAVESEGESHVTYKTANPMMEAGIEVERQDSESDAVESIDAARTITKKMFGGDGRPVAGVGDDAVYGAFNVLYVRKGNVMLTITPPNLQQVAAGEQANAVFGAIGSDDRKKAMDKLSETMKSDPGSKSLARPDAMSGATDLITHSATSQGTEYETRARAMARALAEKVLAKIAA